MPLVESQWHVYTETSRHTIDLASRTVTRTPGAGLGDHPQANTPTTVSELRRDETPVPLLELARCRVGEPLIMLLDLRGDGIATWRETTIVRGIQSANDRSVSTRSLT